MNFPCNELPFCAFSHGFLNGVYYYSQNTGPYIGGRFEDEAQELIFLVLRNYIFCNFWRTHHQLFLVELYWWLLAGLGLQQLKKFDCCDYLRFQFLYFFIYGGNLCIRFISFHQCPLSVGDLSTMVASFVWISLWNPLM